MYLYPGPPSIKVTVPCSGNLLIANTRLLLSRSDADKTPTFSISSSVSKRPSVADGAALTLTVILAIALEVVPSLTVYSKSA